MNQQKGKIEHKPRQTSTAGEGETTQCLRDILERSKASESASEQSPPNPQPSQEETNTPANLLPGTTIQPSSETRDPVPNSPLLLRSNPTSNAWLTDSSFSPASSGIRSLFQVLQERNNGSSESGVKEELASLREVVQQLRKENAQLKVKLQEKSSSSESSTSSESSGEKNSDASEFKKALQKQLQAQLNAQLEKFKVDLQANLTQDLAEFKTHSKRLTDAMLLIKQEVKVNRDLIQASRKQINTHNQNWHKENEARKKAIDAINSSIADMWKTITKQQQDIVETRKGINNASRGLNNMTLSIRTMKEDIDQRTANILGQQQRTDEHLASIQREMDALLQQKNTDYPRLESLTQETDGTDADFNDENDAKDARPEKESELDVELSKVSVPESEVPVFTGYRKRSAKDFMDLIERVGKRRKAP